MGGGNDKAAGTAQTTINANLAATVSAIGNGTKVWAIMPTPWDTQDNTPTATFVRTNYSGTAVGVIDFFNPLKWTFGGYLLATNYASADGIHPNLDGQNVLGLIYADKLQGQ